MSQTEADFYKAVGFFRASGLSESEAFSRAEDMLESIGSDKSKGETTNECAEQNEGIHSRGEEERETQSVHSRSVANPLRHATGA